MTEVFPYIMEMLKGRNSKGHVYLVGAGILGKVYCHQIKKSGGIALDVGSVPDVWVGKPSREYQKKNRSRYRPMSQL
ncbi:MAG: hypothetical protein SWL02_18320 [Pseudomonadota bacterium]|nr:hypothetical protein [Pseudomonadota bacterium]